MDQNTPSPAAAPAANPVAAATTRARPWATGAGLLLPLAIVLGLVVVLVGGIVFAVRWALFTEPGAQWVLGRVPYIEAKGVKGALFGADWQAERLKFTWAGGKASLLLEDVSAEGFSWSWQPVASTWLGLDAQRMTVRKATWTSGPPSAAPFKLPGSLALPIQLQLKEARVAELVIDQLDPLHDVALSGVTLDNRAGAAHAVAALRARWQGYALEGAAQVGHTAPLPLQARLTVTAADAPVSAGDSTVRWAAVMRAAGPLAAFTLDATLRGVPKPGLLPPAIDLRAEVRPEQAWPLGTLNARTEELDLAALHPAAPQTRLSGTAEAVTHGADQPLSATVKLANALPGRWNERRLPIARAELQVTGSLTQRDRIDVPRFEIQLADATRAAGTVRGKALWASHGLVVDGQLDNLSPHRLDGRAAAMTLSGPLTVTVAGLRSPDPAATTPLPPWRVDAKLELGGRLEGRPQAVTLLLAGQADAQGVVLERARVASGGATAEGKATLKRQPRGEWALVTAGTLVNFDPVPWFPGDAGGAWRKGPHRLSGGWQFDARLPADAQKFGALALLPRVAGNGTLRFSESVLAGVPLQAEVALGYKPATVAGGAGAGTLDADLRLGGNRLVLEGRGDPASNGQTDRLRAELNAENLGTLAPMARLHPMLAEWLPRQGSATGNATAAGRWPDLRSEGQVRVQQLLVGALGVARGQADWKLDTSGGQPLSLQVDLADLRWGSAPRQQRVQRLLGEVSGTMAEHRIEVTATSPAAPPPATGRLLGLQTQAGTRALLLAQGAWSRDAGGGGRWLARVDRLLLGAWDGRDAGAAAAAGTTTTTTTTTATTATVTAPGAAASVPRQAMPAALPAPMAWADARDLRAELRFNADGDLTLVTAEPGRLRLADTATLRWDAVRLDFSSAEPRIELRADVEPFAVAPLLARLQPGMGWSGDLKLGARVAINAAERMQVDATFSRQDGDLHVASGDGLLLLGLTDLRGALTARDGTWTFDLNAAGRSLGAVRGSLRARTAPEKRWPAADVPVDGSLNLRVTDIGIWNNFLPVGWRLAGELQAEANISGRFGEPKYTGQVAGQKLSVRNLLQGVNVTDGDVAVRLDGDSARIERFTLRGGEGTLTLTGGADFTSGGQARVSAVAQRFRVLGRVDRQLTVSGRAEMVLGDESLKLDGRVVADEGFFDITRSDAPSLDSDVSVRSAEPVPAAADASAQPRAKRDVRVALDLDMGNNLRLRGRGLDAGLRGQLRVTTPGGRLAVNGSITTDGGTYAAYAQKLEIERGLVAFSGSLDNPRLDVLALRPNIDMRVGLAITGNLLTPRVRLFSEPEMSDSEKMSWLLLGRASDGLGRNDTALIQRAALALLAGEGEAPTDTLLKNLGIDDLSLRQADGDARDTVITLGKQLSRRWYLGYERGVNATAGTWQLIYRIAQRFTLRVQSGLENSLDAIWVWRLGESPVPTEPADQRVRKSIPLRP